MKPNYYWKDFLMKMMMKNEILNPNCSEIVWKLKIDKSAKEKIIDALENIEKETLETDTASFPNNCLNNMIDFLEKVKGNDNINKVELIYMGNLGGGGNWNFVEECFNIAKRYVKGEITRKKAEKLESKFWHGE